jgi:hypothetical protein
MRVVPPVGRTIGEVTVGSIPVAAPIWGVVSKFPAIARFQLAIKINVLVISTGVVGAQAWVQMVTAGQKTMSGWVRSN